MATIQISPEFAQSHMAIERMKAYRPKATQVCGIRRKNTPSMSRSKRGCRNGKSLAMKGTLAWKGNELTEEEYVHHLTPEQIQECEVAMRGFKGKYHKCMNVKIRS